MVNRIYKSKKIMKIIFKIIKKLWPLILVFLFIIYFALQPETKKLTVVDLETHVTEEVTEDDPRVADIWAEGKNFVLNNTNENLILESLSYSTSSYNSYTPEIIYMLPGINPINVQINFMFSTPPQSIRVKSGGTTTRWYLHR
tara:strand:- start:209 stop:637 length:429 start_codon:yes stop_codon:yes gene_type:complete